jgi:Meiotically up-regulated gene 113
MHERWLAEREHILRRIEERKAKEAAERAAKKAAEQAKPPRPKRKPDPMPRHLLDPHLSKFVYVMANREHNLYKIGCTLDVAQRRKAIEREIPIPFPIEVVTTWETYHYEELVPSLHRVLANKRIKGEWFKLAEDDVKGVFRFAEEWLEKHPSVDALAS